MYVIQMCSEFHTSRWKKSHWKPFWLTNVQSLTFVQRFMGFSALKNKKISLQDEQPKPWNPNMPIPPVWDGCGRSPAASRVNKEMGY